MRPLSTTDNAGELREVLDEEIQRLPAKYRDVVILHYFEHRSPAELAHLLHAPKGTIDARLSRARDLLRCRLSKRHVALSAVALASVVSLNYGTVFAPGLIRPCFQGESIPCDVRLLFK